MIVGVGVRVGVCVAVGVGVLVVGVIVGPPGPAREMSSNQISPVGEPSVIRRSVTLVLEPLFHVPLRYCHAPVVLEQSCLSPGMSFISMQAAPTEFVFQIQPE